MKPKKPISDKLRAEDEKLREELRNFDIKRFGPLLKKAISPAKRRDTTE
jgi:hypothetical protein